MKADLAIYSHTVDVGRQCMSESLTLGHNLDFSLFDIMVGFCKSSHICIYVFLYISKNSMLQFKRFHKLEDISLLL